MKRLIFNAKLALCVAWAQLVDMPNLNTLGYLATLIETGHHIQLSYMGQKDQVLVYGKTDFHAVPGMCSQRGEQQDAEAGMRNGTVLFTCYLPQQTSEW